ncbi:Asp-tRNA(Asn)/Glu-tRNA(Gln) amidotransferase subunit GatA [Carboxydocella sp. JDF658]|uniref:Glutamyl-tRNA(Gln) amidotransferase subunit A n=2 Tax=Carboxydocella TaxID=178898 RepID=A0A1T4R2P3_9FIRM|nr:aspartyl/glutamyl-tRNA(Asn/Gln) amidotransferase subunit A [Carboxydocella thermautotrophica]GAW31821.1 aspartyl/glutamyl-tRNA amidotransferase subunit A [Carboxydocella sp. JDF658]SKA10314.1 aspartyl/glutamyl-tRNA(Asn/Gln) amidotransferase subunit A [Carboxydocella sporoproducens DSM 16521]
MSLHTLTVEQASQMLARKEISSVELTRAILDRIEQVDNQVQAFVTVTREQALAQAEEIDRRRQQGEELGPLAGIPFALKDNMCTRGIRTTCSSKILHNFIPPYNATVWDKLQAAGAVLVGKTNLDEFAMGSSTENSGFFPTHNPYDLERVPGGSSGGSAAAVAAGEALFSLGSDTGGSIRQPAAFCGLVGLKPTYGLVSRYGLIAFASSLDQIGPFARTVRDCALITQTIAGHDPKDSTSAGLPVPDYLQALEGGVKGLKVGVPREYYQVEGIQPEIRAAVEKTIKALEDLGAEVGECSLPHTRYALATYYLIAPAEASSNLARYDGVQYGLRVEGEDIVEMYKKTRSQGFGPEVKRRIMLGTYALSSGYYDAYYLKALKVRTLIKQDFDQAFARFDVLLSPTTPTVAFKFGEKAADPISMYLSDIFTMSSNLAGIPAISIPVGLTDGLPVGVQFMGKAFDEATLFRVSYAVEQALLPAPLYPQL